MPLHFPAFFPKWNHFFKMGAILTPLFFSQCNIMIWLDWQLEPKRLVNKLPSPVPDLIIKLTTYKNEGMKMWYQEGAGLEQNVKGKKAWVMTYITYPVICHSFIKLTTRAEAGKFGYLVMVIEMRQNLDRQTHKRKLPNVLSSSFMVNNYILTQVPQSLQNYACPLVRT